jgi:hypothetical protein
MARGSLRTKTMKLLCRNFLFVVSLLVVLVFAVPMARAVEIELEDGFLTSGPGGGITASGGWSGGAFKISWDIDQDSVTKLYTYVYTISDPQSEDGRLAKDLSHWILQVSNTFTSNNLKSGSSHADDGSSPQTYTSTSNGNSNPDMPNAIFGYKFDSTTVTIVTDRAPINGNFYAKDGNCNPFSCPGFDATVAWDTGLAGGTSFIRVPDTTTTTTTSVPEPSALLLFGSGLIVVSGISRRINRRRN